VQLTAPEIRWPKGVDVLEPAITERLQKEVVPVTGTRTYTYTLTADSTGRYTIPPIAFTYFDPGAKKFKTTATDSLHFTILKGDQHAARAFRFSKHLPHSHTAAWLLAGLAAVAIGIFFWLRKYRPVQKPAPTTRIEPGPPDFAKRIQDISPTEALPHRTLQQELMGFLKSLPGQPDVLATGAMQQAAALPGDVQQELQTILHECEAVQYYNAAPAIPFCELQQRAIQVVHSVQQRQPPKRS